MEISECKDKQMFCVTFDVLKYITRSGIFIYLVY